MLTMVAPPLSVLVPMVEEPSWKVTVPVGLPPLALTVAVKVTDWPNTGAVTGELTVVVVAVVVLVAVTVWVKLPAALELLAKLPSVA